MAMNHAGDGNWIAEKAKTATILTMRNCPIKKVVFQAKIGFVIININEVFVCICHASRSCPT